jgi:predicted secreted Zn-dependent protease
VKKGRESAELLKHEQGHFDIGRLCQLELIAQLEKAVVLPADISTSVGRIFSTTMDKYQKMGLRYDAETAHSINKVAQVEWDSLLAAELKRALAK